MIISGPLVLQAGARAAWELLGCGWVCRLELQPWARLLISLLFKNDHFEPPIWPEPPWVCLQTSFLFKNGHFWLAGAGGWGWGSLGASGLWLGLQAGAPALGSFAHKFFNQK